MRKSMLVASAALGLTLSNNISAMSAIAADTSTPTQSVTTSTYVSIGRVDCNTIYIAADGLVNNASAKGGIRLLNQNGEIIASRDVPGKFYETLDVPPGTYKVQAGFTWVSTGVWYPRFSSNTLDMTEECPTPTPTPTDTEPTPTPTSPTTTEPTPTTTSPSTTEPTPTVTTPTTSAPTSTTSAPPVPVTTPPITSGTSTPVAPPPVATVPVTTPPSASTTTPPAATTTSPAPLPSTPVTPSVTPPVQPEEVHMANLTHEQVQAIGEGKAPMPITPGITYTLTLDKKTGKWTIHATAKKGFKLIGVDAIDGVLPPKYLTLTMQIDRYSRSTRSLARKVPRYTTDRWLNYREDRAHWGNSKYEFVTVRVPVNYSPNQLIKAINAKTKVGDISTTGKHIKPGSSDVIVAWKLGKGANTRLPWGKHHDVSQRLVGVGYAK